MARAPDAGDVEELARAQRHLEALLRCSEPLHALTDSASVARVAAEQGATLIPGIECAVAMRDPDDRTVLRIAGGAGPTFTARIGRTVTLPGTLAERVLATNEPVESRNAAVESPVAASMPEPPDTARLVPLLVSEPGAQTVSLGVIGYYRHNRDGFLPEERRLLDEYGSRVAGALHRARLLEGATRTARRLRAGVDVAIDLGSSLDPRQVIRRLIERIATAVDAHRTSFGRVDGEVVVIEDSHAIGAEPVARGSTWRIDDIPLLRAAVYDRRPVQIGVGAPRDAPTVALMGRMQHTLVMPLLSERQTVAVLSVSRLQDVAFDEEALSVLQQIGIIAVLALRNARLFEARRDFMNMAAHELRTPLTVLNGYVSMLRDGTFGPPSERWTPPLDMVAGKIGELSRLVDDLLIGARLERDAMSSNPQDVDLVGLVHAAVERARPRAAMLRGHVEVAIEAGMLPVRADPDDLGRVLDNLINNALTYSDGTPWVRLTARRRGGMAQVAVADRGRGIAEELHERVFEQFYRIEDPQAGYNLGTGLGLYISRGLAELQGGSLQVERSSPGEGSVFVLELPLLGD